MQMGHGEGNREHGRVRPEPKTLEEKLNHSLHQCGRYLYCRATGPRQQMVLQLLQKNGSLSQQEIMEHMEVQAGSISELLSKLERKGMIARERDPEDRRKVRIALTEIGRAQRVENPEQAIARRYGVLTREEQEILFSLVSRLLESWNRGEEEK